MFGYRKLYENEKERHKWAAKMAEESGRIARKEIQLRVSAEAERDNLKVQVAQLRQELAKGTLHCSFCGKSQHDVKKLIAGPVVFICDECVDICKGVLADGAHVSSVTNEMIDAADMAMKHLPMMGVARLFTLRAGLEAAMAARKSA